MVKRCQDAPTEVVCCMTKLNKDDGRRLNREGFAVEHDIAARLVRLGFNVAKSNASAPWDLVADWKGNVNRIQVKSVARPVKTSGRTHRVFIAEHYNKSSFDFLVVNTPWANYVLPVEKIHRKKHLNFWDRGQHRTNRPCDFEEFREAGELLQ